MWNKQFYFAINLGNLTTIYIYWLGRKKSELCFSKTRAWLTMTILYIHRTKGFYSGLSFIFWVYHFETFWVNQTPPPHFFLYNSWSARFTCINIIRKHCPNHPSANCFYGWWTELVMWGICVAELTKDKLWQLPPKAGSRLFYVFFGGWEAKR